nr:immunoglobulin heavy chain junction region [Macaca mulatta]
CARGRSGITMLVVITQWGSYFDYW